MISLVLPTYNESANITSLIDVLDAVLSQTPHEIIVVDDDSPDGTWKIAEHLSRTHPSVRVLRRIGRKGLSSAVVEGFDMAMGDILAVMDADGQHDPELLLKLLSSLRSGADLAIGSRYVAGGSVGEWVRDRRIISTTGTLLAHSLSRVRVSDPLGGFFALKASLYKKIRTLLRPTGFKILLEILANIPSTTIVAEVPLIFRMRLHGASKLSLKVHLEFGLQVLRLSFRHLLFRAQAAGAFIFFLVAILMMLSLLPRAWAMKSFFLAPDLRHTAATSLKTALDREGWLLSDLEVVAVTKQGITVIHREHRRHPSPPKKCTLALPSTTFVCAE